MIIVVELRQHDKWGALSESIKSHHLGQYFQSEWSRLLAVLWELQVIRGYSSRKQWITEWENYSFMNLLSTTQGGKSQYAANKSLAPNTG